MSSGDETALAIREAARAERHAERAAQGEVAHGHVDLQRPANQAVVVGKRPRRRVAADPGSKADKIVEVLHELAAAVAPKPLATPEAALNIFRDSNQSEFTSRDTFTIKKALSKQDNADLYVTLTPAEREIFISDILDNN